MYYEKKNKCWGCLVFRQTQFCIDSLDFTYMNIYIMYIVYADSPMLQ